MVLTEECLNNICMRFILLFLIMIIIVIIFIIIKHINIIITNYSCVRLVPLKFVLSYFFVLSSIHVQITPSISYQNRDNTWEFNVNIKKYNCLSNKRFLKCTNIHYMNDQFWYTLISPENKNKFFLWNNDKLCVSIFYIVIFV